jgi:hypothetical protein
MKVKSINLNLKNSKAQKMGNICYVIVSDTYVGLIITYALLAAHNLIPDACAVVKEAGA